MKILLGCLVALSLGFGLGAFASSRLPARAEPAPVISPVISTNEGGCWDKCKTCEQKCKDNNDCKNKCWDTNNSCCSGVGGKGVYKMCGCTDK